MIFIEPGTKAKDRMMSYIPDFYINSKVMNSLMDSRGKEIDFFNEKFEDILNQFFVKKATWGLKFHEEQHGLPINENLSHEDRRKSVSAKKRSGRTNLVSILQAEEPSLSLAWGGLILPFTIFTDEDVYSLKPLLVLLRRHAPGHLGYSFKLEPEKAPLSGYTVNIKRISRFEKSVELLAGSAITGRYPWWSSPGSSGRQTIDVISTIRSGNGLFKQTANLYSGGKEERSNSGVILTERIEIKGVLSSGISKFSHSGNNESGIYPQVVNEGSAQKETIRFQSFALSGNGHSFPCGINFSGEEVA